MTELALQSDAALLLNVSTGELLPATVDNARIVLEVAREIEQNIRAVKQEATAFLVEESQRRGTKTLHAPHGGAIELTGGPGVEYDAADLMEALRAAGCAEDVLAEIVKEEITYKVDRRRLNAAMAANPDYRAAAELAERPVEKPWRATVK